MTIRVLTALADPSFDEVVIRRLSRADVGVTLARRCVDIVDLRTAAGSGLADVAVVDTCLSGLDRDTVTELHARGIRVVLVTSAPDTAPALGGDAVVGLDVDAVVGALRGGITTRSPKASSDVGSSSRVVAVWGPMGSPGRTTVAIGLADEASRLGVSTLLIDADTYGPSVAQRLGLLSDTSGLAAACRLAGQGRLDPAALHRVSVMLPSGFTVVTGLPRAAGWEELRPSALDAVVETARSVHALTVVDVGFCLEHDSLMWFEPGTPSRNQAAVSLLGAADVVVAVAGADSTALVRLLQALPDLKGLAPTAEIQVVINQAPRGQGALRQVEQVLYDHSQTSPIAILTTDRGAAVEAARDGRTIAEVSPRSPLRQQLRSLAGRIAGVPIPTRRRRVA